MGVYMHFPGLEYQTNLLRLRVSVRLSNACTVTKRNKMLSYRRETALQGAL